MISVDISPVQPTFWFTAVYILMKSISSNATGLTY